MSITRLTAILAQIAQEDYPVHSRVHKLRVGDVHHVDCYVKREDELGCLVSGSKVRKYRCLIAGLKKKGCKKAALIGSQYSNQILGLSALLLENQIQPELFLLKSSENRLTGNALFSHLLVAKDQIHYIDRALWPSVYEIADKGKHNHSDRCVISEGGSISECIGGLITLALDIMQNEAQIGTTFQHILIDSGSGTTAASLIACFGYLKKSVHVHVMLAAGGSSEFYQKVDEAKKTLEAYLQEAIAWLPPFSLYTPTVAKSFGATTSTIFTTIRDVAQKEGFFLDPIYSAKLYLLLQKLTRQKVLASPVLFIHSGGIFSLAGFQDRLQI